MDMLRGKLVSVDIETTGLDPNKHSVLEVAAVVFHLDPENTLVDTFHAFIKHDVVHWDDSTFDFHMKNGYFDYRSSEAVRDVSRLHPGGFYEAFVAFLARSGAYDDTVTRGGGATAVGKNFASFDLQFLKRLDPRFSHTPNRSELFKHRTVDIGNLVWNPLTDGVTLPESKLCAQRLGYSAAGVTHRALDDATIMMEMCRNLIRRLVTRKPLTQD